MNRSTPGLPVHHQLPEFTQLTSIESVMSSSHLTLCHPLLLPPITPSIRVFSNESTLCMRWPKYWSFSFSISPSNSGLISFRMDWLDLLAVQETQESSPTPQFKSINPSALSFLYSPILTSIRDYWKIPWMEEPGRLLENWQVTVINDIFVYWFGCRPNMKPCFPRPHVGKLQQKTGAKTLHIM